MQLIKKPDYSYITTSHFFEDMQLYFLSRELGIPQEALTVDFPSLPPFFIFQRIAAHFPVTQKSMTFMNQVHSDNVVNKTNKKPSFPTADAIITKERQIALCLKTADCVPCFLYDSQNKVIAAIHAGWRGTALKLVKKTLKKLEQLYKSEPNNIFAFIGPAIGPCCYNVGKDVVEHFHFLGKAKQDFIQKIKGEKYMLDLKGINAFLLAQLGIPEENIEISDLCTSCNEELFYSYRRDKDKAGRNISFITLL